ncbi:GNAT family N-acetyltransferase [Streptacidiphilus sp. ASG 303]|uniref:GNAT family N-acetyltransferase n=1 Tax=Streptacidiphilus sp. ASG 303 TaxID=2896847 RepID=UPI001E4E39D4|nr:GNAT family N-acetyltransferase [Streptacidiphilus sp. ASG 303]MCD0481558.1 GNAT family N-acetyltransferase [Streptacidiphilus sp. ASG 303]
MARTVISVREARPADLPELAEGWALVHGLLGRWSRGLPGPSAEDLAEVLERAAGSPDARFLVASVDGAAAGMAYLTLRPLSPLHGVRAAHVDYLHVRDGFRRGGVGRALLAAAASYAEEAGVSQVAVNVHPGLRDANRFFARWGFAPVVVRRAVPVAALRRRLLGDAAGARTPARGREAARRVLQLRRPAPLTEGAERALS